MLYEFQVLFRRADGSGELLDKLVPAETADQARRLIETDGQYRVHCVGPGRPLIDPEQRWFTKEEAAVYIRAKCSSNDRPSLIDKLMADGTLPRPKAGNPLFPRWTLDEALCRRTGSRMEDAA